MPYCRDGELLKQKTGIDLAEVSWTAWLSNTYIIALSSDQEYTPFSKFLTDAKLKMTTYKGYECFSVPPDSIMLVGDVLRPPKWTYAIAPDKKIILMGGDISYLRKVIDNKKSVHRWNGLSAFNDCYFFYGEYNPTSLSDALCMRTNGSSTQNSLANIYPDIPYTDLQQLNAPQFRMAGISATGKKDALIVLLGFTNEATAKQNLSLRTQMVRSGLRSASNKRKSDGTAYRFESAEHTGNELIFRFSEVNPFSEIIVFNTEFGFTLGPP